MKTGLTGDYNYNRFLGMILISMTNEEFSQVRYEIPLNEMMPY